MPGTTPGESFSAGGGGQKSTPPDFYSTMASRRSQAPPPDKKSNPGDEVIQALTAVFEVFKKLEAKLGGKPDPNLDAAKEDIKKFVATTLKMDPSVLEGGTPSGAGAGAPPPDSASAAPPPPPPGAGDTAPAAA
jgi:hypothetical protein